MNATAREQADLVAMSTHGRSGLDRLRFGSVAESVVRRAPVPVLLVRGTAGVELMDDIVPEYALATERYLGAEQGRAWLEQLRGMVDGMARITIHPEAVRILDFQTRFPSALGA